MGTVTSIDGAEKTTEDDCIDLPSDLELLALRIRRGDESAKRAIIVWQDQGGYIRHLALGESITRLEAAGLLGWGLTQIRDQ